jgi:CRP/FNR family transcriptional regulator, cyclic AMP receptor protein
LKTEILLENEELLQQLKDVSVLQSFGKKDVKQILRFSKLKKFVAGEVLIEEGSYDNWVYVLLSGEVSVMKHANVIDVLRRSGDIFGEMCIIDGSPRSASIKANSSGSCLATDVSFIDNLVNGDKLAFCAIFYQMIAEVLAGRLRETSAELVRVEEELARLKGTRGKGG